MSIIKTFRSLPNRTLRMSILSLLCVAGLSYAGGRLTISRIENHAARAEAERISTHIRLVFLEIDSESFWKDPSSAKSKALYRKIGKNPMLLKVEQLHSLKIWDNTGNLLWVDEPHRLITPTGNKKSRVLQPCAGRNPCAKSNPCAGKNPCAGGNPCAGDSKSPGRIDTLGGTNGEQGKWLRLGDDNTYQMGVCEVCLERVGKEFPIVKTRVPIWQGGIKKAGAPNLTVEIQTEPDFLFVKLKSDQNLIWTITGVVGFTTYLIMLGAMLWTARHRETAEKQAVRLEIANKIAKAVSSTLDPEEVFKIIVREIRRAVPCERYVIASVDEKTKEYNYLHTESETEVRTLTTRQATQKAENFYSRIYESKRPLNIPELKDEHISWSAHLQEAGLRSHLAVPILLDGRCIAHIALSSTKVNAFSAESEEFFAAVSSHLGSAIWNAAQFRTSEERASRFATLNDLSRMIAENLDMEGILENIARASMELTWAEKSRIFLLDEEADVYNLCASYGSIPDKGTFSLKPGEGLVGFVAQTGEGLIVPDIQNDPRWFNLEWARKYELHSYIAQPICQNGKSTVIIVCFSRKKNFFDQEDLNLLDALASQAAIAIEKGRLIEEAHKHAARQEIAAMIAKTAGSTLEPEELFKTISKEIRRAVSCERCVISTIDNSQRTETILHSESEPQIEAAGIESQLLDWLIREVYEPKKTVTIPDIGEVDEKWASIRYQEGFRSILFVPILQDEKTIAHLGLVSTRIEAFSKDDEKLVTSIASHLGSAIRNATLFRTSEERALRFATLNELNQKISKNLDLSEVLASFAQATENLIRADHVRIFLLDESSSQLNLRASSGEIPGPVIGQQSFSPGQGLTGKVFQEGKPISISDIQNDPQWINVEWAKERGLHSFISHPIYRGEEAVGVISCLSISPGFFGKEELELLGALASQASVAIQNAGLYEEAEKKGARLATLVEVAQRLTRGLDLPTVLKSISEAAATLFEGEAGFRLLTGDYLVRAGATQGAYDAMRATRIRVGDSISGMVAETGEPIITANSKDNPLIPPEHREFIQEDRVGAMMCVPVKLGESILGTLHIYRERGYRFDKEALQLAASLADQAAVAIENARLHGEAQRGLDFFRSVVDDNADAVMVLDLERKIIHWNSGAEKLYGYTETEALGKSIDIIVPPDERGIDQGNMVHTKGISNQFETNRLKKDGTSIPVSVTISPVKNDTGQVIATSAVHKDLTEQKRADEALRQSEERFRNLVEFAGDAIFVNDFDGNFIDVNQRACDTLGYTREELLKLNVRDIELTFDASQHSEQWNQITNGEPITIEGIHERKDKKTFPVEIRLGKFELNGQELIVSLARDMTERKQAEEKLLLAMGEAEAANAAKTEFLSNMSHELRSPLNSVIGFSDILLRDSKDELVEQLAPKIRESGKYLTRLIEDILDFERIETGKVQLELKDTSINDLVNETVIALESRLPEEFTVELDLNFSGEVIRCDPTRIRQVLTNLLDNAVKYSPGGGTITVRTRIHSEEIRVSVQDGGLGMNQEEMESIFERFHQLESGYKRRSGGLGIGLSLIRQLLELHGGHIWVESEIGKGSTFTFSLPLSPVQANEDPASLDGHPGQSNGDQDEPWAGRRILIVDDVEHYHEYIKLLMKSAGQIFSAYNGEEGIEMAIKEKPDIILMDLRMPVLDGFDAITNLKGNPDTKDIPIMALSAQSMEEADASTSVQLGADGFTSKPIDIKKLQKEMTKVFSLKKKIST